MTPGLVSADVIVGFIPLRECGSQALRWLEWSTGNHAEASPFICIADVTLCFMVFTQDSVRMIAHLDEVSLVHDDALMKPADIGR